MTYILTPTGYQILIDGVLAIDCPHDPSKVGATPFTDDAAKLAHIAENYPDAVAA